jgi:hypothetical protein
MTGDPLAFLEAWYAAQCNGDWEHEFGVTLETLDNPGWRLKVDLVGTALEGRVTARNATESTEAGWLHFWSDGTAFHAAGGDRSLRSILAAFAAFAQS